MSTKQDWEEVYTSKPETRVSWYATHLDLSLQLIDRAAPNKSARIIDVGGGASTLVDDLLDQVLTVLDRLHDKELVMREKEGKAFFYRPRVTREVWLGERAVQALTDAHEPPNQAVLMAFLDSAEKADPALLDRLSTMIAQRRKERTR